MGGGNIGEKHTSRRAKRRVLLGGLGVCPPENVFKRCNLVCFGVYLDKILSLKKLKNCYFYIKCNNLDTRFLCGNSRKEMFGNVFD